jgi:hypothetical protein
MKLTEQNAQYIQLLNKNNIQLEKNASILGERLKVTEDALSSLARDAAAMQRAMIEFLREKKIIAGDDDLKLLQKFHMRSIAQLDQEIAKKKDEIN